MRFLGDKKSIALDCYLFIFVKSIKSYEVKCAPFCDPDPDNNLYQLFPVRLEYASWLTAAWVRLKYRKGKNMHSISTS